MLDLATTAAGAYNHVAKITSPFASPNMAAGDTSDSQPTGFGAMVSGFIDSVGNAGKAADSQAALSVKGKGDMVDMVTAIAESEVALESLVSVRDKVISAYEEIMRMPI
jgi:flagellar hook-basal body complex protein FliE